MPEGDAGDGNFGRAADAKAEAAERLETVGKDPTEAAEGEGIDPRPRAGGKASAGSPPAAGRQQDDGGDRVDEADGVDEAGRESFPASDPPATY